MKDLVLFAASFYLLKQDVLRLSRSGATNAAAGANLLPQSSSSPPDADTFPELPSAGMAQRKTSRNHEQGCQSA
jgi:hypothetical protein